LHKKQVEKLTNQQIPTIQKFNYSFTHLGEAIINYSLGMIITRKIRKKTLTARMPKLSPYFQQLSLKIALVALAYFSVSC
jgi:hypothetical protein